jgi:malate dehydrogenase
MTRLDHNRAQHQLAEQVGQPVAGVEQVIIWGNHSSTMFPDTRYTHVAKDDINQHFTLDWYNKHFIPVV